MAKQSNEKPQWRVSTVKAGKGRAVVRHWIVRPAERAGHFPTAEIAQAECDKRNAQAA